MYGYSYIVNEIKKFENNTVLGTSCEGRDIFSIQIGNGECSAVFAAAFHGLEYLTAPALLSFAHKFSKMSRYHNKLKLFIVPMVNPDGVEIALHGINPQLKYHRDIINNLGITEFCKTWQANAAGVDINHNFNANWQQIQPFPSPTKFGGEYPESEPETRAITSLLRKVQPELFIAFHSQGKEIYYDFNGMENKLAKGNAEYIADLCGYRAATTEGTASFGGAKDWYIQEYHKEAYTIELGYGKNPLPHSQLDDMIRDTYTICMGLIDRILT